MRRHVYTVPTMSTVYVESSCREFMSTVHVESSCREFMLRVYVERLCSDFTRHVMFRLHSSNDVLRHWACSDGMFFADALSESCIFNETTTKVLSTLTTPRDSQHNTLSMHHRLILDYGMGITHVDGYGALRASVSVNANQNSFEGHGLNSC